MTLEGRFWRQKNQPPTSEKKLRLFFILYFFKIMILSLKFLLLVWKFSCQPQKYKLDFCTSNGHRVLIYLSFLLFLKEVALFNVEVALSRYTLAMACLSLYCKLLINLKKTIIGAKLINHCNYKCYNSKNRHLEF